MQSMDIISINFWQIIISLLNLLILFLILKRFLYKPVRNVLAKRQEKLDEEYDAAKAANSAAQTAEAQWTEKLEQADRQADKIISDAKETAGKKGEQMLAQAREDAQEIMARARQNAELEKKKAEDEIRREIVSVSALLSEEILKREIKEDDHRRIIDGVLTEMEDGNATDQ